MSVLLDRLKILTGPRKFPWRQFAFELAESFRSILTVHDLDVLLGKVTQEVPKLINAQECSIYLVPNLVPQFNGWLVDGQGNRIKGSSLSQHYIVLASASDPQKKDHIGKAFYTVGSGLTGWIFANSKSLRISDMANRAELATIDPNLEWRDSYGYSKLYYTGNNTNPKPFLGVPLIGSKETLGVIKVPASKNNRPFSELDELTLANFSKVVANVIERTKIMQEQGEAIGRLVNMVAAQDIDDSLLALVNEAAKLMRARNCCLYLIDNTGKQLKLRTKSDEPIVSRVSRLLCDRFYDDESLLSWVVYTRKHLILSDVFSHSAKKATTKNVGVLQLDLMEIDQQDDLEWLNQILQKLSNENVEELASLMAVPILDSYQNLRGVLQTIRTYELPGSENFDAHDLARMMSFASAIYAALEHDKQRRLAKLLIDLSGMRSVVELFERVVNRIPELVQARTCDVFIIDTIHNCLRLKASNVATHLQTFSEHVYEIGEGKTGFAAQTGLSLIINHYGHRLKASERLGRDYLRYQAMSTNLVEYMRDKNRARVGLIRVIGERESLEKNRDAFSSFCSDVQWDAEGIGLSTPKENLFNRDEDFSTSFMAVPVKDREETIGVLRLSCTVEGRHFSEDDLHVLESIASYIGKEQTNMAMVEKLEMDRKERSLLIETLAHEIHTPITSILADSYNVLDELQERPETAADMKHNIDEVKRLQLMSLNILAGLSGKELPRRQFTRYSLGKVVMDACEMFMGEAKHKGCDILDPEPPALYFPEIEMYKFDLEIAIKNIVHNAVKYSFFSSSDERFIRITGKWWDQQRTQYAVSVQNYGVGITEEELKSRSIFSAGKRGAMADDRERIGTGLGLAQVRRVIEDLHGGEILVTSEPMPHQAYLTTFTVVLPISQRRRTFTHRES